MSARRFVRDNSLTLFFGGLLLAALAGQSAAGRLQLNSQRAADGEQPLSYLRYITSSSFAADVAENWQSEYLQFFLMITATVWLVQRGSTESKAPGEQGADSDEQQRVGARADAGSPAWARAGGWRTALFSRSLGAVMLFFFLGSWLAQSIAGRVAYNAQDLPDGDRPLSWGGYVTSSDFWSRTLQNWQSEFLAVASMAALSVYLRQRGSAESKPVGARDEESGG